jgi:hypothetical protein
MDPVIKAPSVFNKPKCPSYLRIVEERKAVKQPDGTLTFEATGNFRSTSGLMIK